MLLLLSDPGVASRLCLGEGVGLAVTGGLPLLLLWLRLKTPPTTSRVGGDIDRSSLKLCEVFLVVGVVTGSPGGIMEALETFLMGEVAPPTFLCSGENWTSPARLSVETCILSDLLLGDFLVSLPFFLGVVFFLACSSNSTTLSSSSSSGILSAILFFRCLSGDLRVFFESFLFAA